MKTLHKLLALSSLALFASPLLPAQTITTLTCQTSGGSTLTIPAYAFTLKRRVRPLPGTLPSIPTCPGSTV